MFICACVRERSYHNFGNTYCGFKIFCRNSQFQSLISWAVGSTQEVYSIHYKMCGAVCMKWYYILARLA